MSKVTDITVEEAAEQLLTLAYSNAEKMRIAGKLSGNDLGRLRADKETFLKSATSLLKMLIGQAKAEKVDKKPQVKQSAKNEN